MGALASRCYHTSRTKRTDASRTPSTVRPAATASGPRGVVERLQRTAGNASVVRMLSDAATGRIHAQKSKAVQTSFEDCPKNAKQTIDQATATARGWVGYAIQQLDAVLANPAKADPNVDALL